MLFMNEFLQQHWDGMRLFLQTVSSLDSDIPTTSFDGYVDLPLRLAVLHGLLVDIIYQRDQVGQQVVTCFHGGDLCLFMVVFMALKACWVGLWSLKGSEFPLGIFSYSDIRLYRVWFTDLSSTSSLK